MIARATKKTSFVIVSSPLDKVQNLCSTNETADVVCRRGEKKGGERQGNAIDERDLSIFDHARAQPKRGCPE